jgi:hypothetical protein
MLQECNSTCLCMDQESHFQRQMEKLFFLKKVSLGGNNAVHVILLLEIYDVPTVTMNILDAATQPKSIFKVQFLQCCPARRHTKKQKCVFGLPKSLFLTLRLQGGEHQVIFLKSLASSIRAYSIPIRSVFNTSVFNTLRIEICVLENIY